MKTLSKHPNRILGLFPLLCAILFLPACKKSSEPSIQSPDGSISASWECMAPLPGGDKYYLMELENIGQAVTGEIQFRDGNSFTTGLITGTLKAGALNFTAVFDKPVHSFRFTGEFNPNQVPDSINGKLSTLQPAVKNNTTDLSICLKKLMEGYHCLDTFKLNPYLFRKVHTAGIPGNPPVIFVHGMTATLKCWDSIIAHLSPVFLQKHDVYVYQYNWKDSITVNGRALLDSVIQKGITSPILVGHSMGGLVSRAYVAAGGTLTKLVTLGTPHLGTPLVELINLFCFANFPGPRQMYPDVGFIPNMLTNPNDIAARSKYYVIAGEMGGYYYTVGGNSYWQWMEPWYATVDKIGFEAFRLVGPQANDGLVNETSASFDTLGVPVNRPLPVQQYIDHFNLIQPSRAPQIMDFINGL
jgi:pimeloyl-ACP methyl ester carboxylesterase